MFIKLLASDAKFSAINNVSGLLSRSKVLLPYISGAGKGT
jgi:hypothetical protein